MKLGNGKILLVVFLLLFFNCKKNNNSHISASPFDVSFTVNGLYNGTSSYTNVNTTPVIRFSFSSPVQQAGLEGNFSFTTNNSATAFTATLQNNNTVVVIQPATPLNGLAKYILSISPGMLSSAGGNLSNPVSVTLITSIDSTDKFPQVSDSALLTLVQQQTFKYFWDFGHPTSGLSRERTTSADLVTIGGSGFGVMSVLVGINRNFITRAQGLSRISTIVSFLTTKAVTYHGAFPHWMNGVTGATIPFSTQDDGADLVETAYMMQGLLCARQYFSSTSDAGEIGLRAAINNLWNGVQWSWFRQNAQNTLYWHWSPDYNWSSNQQINGWNEALIVYALAASSNIDSNSIPKIVYDNGWALNGAIANGNSYFGVKLPLGPAYGGPLFFAHYSFLGIDPRNLSDAYANYWVQDTAHATINYLYCVNNPGKFNGYSSACWGLTASDEENGYAAHAPDNDDGVISPTAAISSLPYTPVQSMNALRFFYYKLGDKIWGQYGFADAFNLTNIWFDNDFLAIDQGPEIVMIENYRSGLLWNLFMSCPEIKKGMKNLGFQSPAL
jgi:hypothetical protein